MRRTFGALVFALATIRIEAQSLYALNDHTVVRINTSTGAQTPIATVAINGFTGASAFDAAGRRLFYIGAIPGGTALVTVNVATGAVSQVTLPGLVEIAEFDPISGKLLSLLNGAVVMIDPITGAVTTVVASVSGPIFTYISTFDAAARKLYFTKSVPGGSSLVSVNIATGQVSQVPLTGSYGLIEFDPVTKMLLARRDNDTIVSIDPMTGAILSTIATGIVAYDSFSSLDVGGRSLFLMGPVGVGTQLITLNVSTGATTQQPLSGTFSFMEFDSLTSQIPAVGFNALIALMAIFAIAGAFAIRK